MKPSSSLLATACFLAVLSPLSFGSFAQKSKTKTPAKKPAQSASSNNGAIVLGAKQLPGDFGEFGKSYAIGTEVPLNFSLISAEYRADKFVGENSTNELTTWVPFANQKFLVLKYSVQNPSNKDARLWYMSFKLIAVGPDGQNTERGNLPWVEGQSKYQDMQLKPAQKVTLTAFIPVASQGETPKLIVQRGFDDKAAVVRYDLRGKVKKIADPIWSTNGIDTLDTIDAKLDTYYPWCGADIQVNGVEDLGKQFADIKADSGKKLVAIKLKAKGGTPVAGRVWYGQFNARITTSDGETEQVRTFSNLFRGGRPDTFDGTIPKGEEQGLRLVVQIPDNVSLDGVQLSFRNYDEIRRTYKFSLKN